LSLTVSVFIATSLDGSIARPDGHSDWLEEANASVPPGEDCGYAAFMADGDAVTLIKGRKLKGSSLTLKVCAKVKSIRLLEGDHAIHHDIHRDIDCKIDGIGAMQLKPEFVKKA
jgi:alkylphosphonate utilization operon protein PhnA